MEERIVLVDEQGNDIGYDEKLKVHLEGKLHKAFSIFIFNNKKKLLLQKRAADKYHSGGMWTNTCCSHQRENESFYEALHRRLKEEVGFDCDLKELGRFVYRAEFNNGLIEHELDYVYIGEYDGEPEVNPNEIEEWKWVELEELKKDVVNNPSKYTCWLKPALEKVLEYLNK